MDSLVPLLAILLDNELSEFSQFCFDRAEHKRLAWSGLLRIWGIGFLHICEQPLALNCASAAFYNPMEEQMGKAETALFRQNTRKLGQKFAL